MSVQCEIYLQRVAMSTNAGVQVLVHFRNGAQLLGALWGAQEAAGACE